MTSNEYIRVENQKWDRCSRSGYFIVGAKRAPFHTYCPLLTSTESDWRSYVESRTIYPHETSHAGMVVSRVFDLKKSLGAMQQSLAQTTLSGLPANQSKSDIINASIMMVDPCSEYTRYAFHRDALIGDPNTATAIRRLARKVAAAPPRDSGGGPRHDGTGRDGPHNNLWIDLSRNDAETSSAVSETLAVQQNWHVDIALPPAPASNNEDMLAVSKKINRVSQAVWSGNNCANYNILTPEFFSRERSIDALLAYLASLDTTFCVLKFKNNYLEEVSNYAQRLQLKRLLEGINEIKSNNPNRIFMLLEAGYAAYPAAAGGFDIVSTSLRALDRDGIGFAHDAAGRGGYFGPKQMIVLPWRHVKKMLEKNGLPCSCGVCRGINSIPSTKSWNQQRRSHYIHCASRMFSELTHLVDEQKIEMAIQRLSQSEISNFTHVLPYVHS